MKAFGYSLQGLAATWRAEASFRLEVIAAAILLPVAVVVPVTTVEHVLLIASVLLVIVVELLNSSLEATIDRISLDHHPLAKRAKDTGSAAVLMAIVIALVVWGATLGPWLLARIFAAAS